MPFKNGKPMIADDFWSHVHKYSGGCWRWRRTVDGRGYGQLTVNGRLVRAHRHAYELTNGPIPEGAVLCHSCDYRLCVNPAHLFVGSQRDNMQDMASKGRVRKVDTTHCKNGHEYTPENTRYRDPAKKHRVCRTCIRESSLRAYYRKRDAA